MIPLSKEQRDVINSKENLLIIGGPGSGKTTVAIIKAKEEIEKLSEFQEILFLSFSNSAVNQIRQAANIEFCKEDLKKFQIQTFHSFCFSILRSYSSIIGIHPPINIFPPEEKIIARTKYNLNSPRQIEEYLLNMAFENSKIAFDLFAKFSLNILKNSKRLLTLFQQSYPIIIVDEFQDTDDYEYNLILLLGEQSRLICLADPFQRIYDFRPGVTPGRVDKYKEEFNPDVVDLADENHRSKESKILESANSILHGGSNFIESDDVKFVTFKYKNQASISLKYEIVNMQRKLQKKGVNKPIICILSKTHDMNLEISKDLKKKTPKANFVIGHDLCIDTDKMTIIQGIICTFLESSCNDNRLEYLSNILDSVVTR